MGFFQFIAKQKANNLKRGLLAVQAYVFLTSLRNGESIDDANLDAIVYNGADIRKSVIQETISYIALNHKGRQLPMIKEARQKGFKG